MHIDPDSIRHWLHGERQILRELALMLAVAVVLGTFFLERSRDLLDQAERQALDAIATQVARDTAEYLVTGNRISLNVVAAHTASLKPVAKVELRDAAGRLLAVSGQALPDTPPRARPVHLDDQGVVGTVEVWPARLERQATARLETVFVLVTLCLLGLRILMELASRRLWPEHHPDRAASVPDETLVPVLNMTPPAAGDTPGALLRISVVNLEHMQQRYTAGLIQEMLADYQRLLERVAEVYGARIEQQLSSQCALVFNTRPRAEALFKSLCAGMLFLRMARRLSDSRKAAGRMSIEFKVLSTARVEPESSWSLCEAGMPGRVHVPEDELVRNELDARVLYDPRRCLTVRAGDHSLRLQPVEQVAQRYQRLIADQAERLSDGAEVSSEKR